MLLPFKVRTLGKGHKNLKQSVIGHLLSKRQRKWEIVSKFVAFLENLNFTVVIRKLSREFKFLVIIKFGFFSNIGHQMMIELTTIVSI